MRGCFGLEVSLVIGCTGLAVWEVRVLLFGRPYPFLRWLFAALYDELDPSRWLNSSQAIKAVNLSLPVGQSRSIREMRLEHITVAWSSHKFRKFCGLLEAADSYLIFCLETPPPTAICQIHTVASCGTPIPTSNAKPQEYTSNDPIQSSSYPSVFPHNSSLHTHDSLQRSHSQALS